MRTHSRPNRRHQVIIDFVRTHSGCRVREVQEWAVSGGRASSSTIYADISELVSRGELQRIRTGHGEILLLPGTESVADLGTVRECIIRALDSKRSRELRIAALADLVHLSAVKDILPNPDVIRLLSAAIADKHLPGRSLGLDLLQRVVFESEAKAASNRDLVDWTTLWRGLQRALKEPLLNAIHGDLAEAAWASSVLALISKGGNEKEAAMMLLRSALDTSNGPMTTFDAVKSAVVRGIAELLAASPKAPAMRRDLRLELDRALDSKAKEIRQRARKLRNELRGPLLGAGPQR